MPKDEATSLFGSMVHCSVRKIGTFVMEMENALDEKIRDRHMSRTIVVNAMSYVLAHAMAAYIKLGSDEDLEKIMGELYPSLQHFLGEYIVKYTDGKSVTFMDLRCKKPEDPG